MPPSWKKGNLLLREIDSSRAERRLVTLQATIEGKSLGPAVCPTGKPLYITVLKRSETEHHVLPHSLCLYRVSEARSFPPKNSTSYGDLRESGPPASRPPYSDRSRVSPPPSSIGSRYTKPPSTYRDDGPPRSNPNVNYSRPPVPRDPIGPPPARGSSPPPRRPYEAPVGNSPASNRPYGYAANPSGPPEPYAGGRPGYDRYAPPGDAYRERDRTADYRGLPAAVVVPPADRYYPAAAAPLPPADPYVRSAYERQPPQYDR